MTSFCSFCDEACETHHSLPKVPSMTRTKTKQIERQSQQHVLVFHQPHQQTPPPPLYYWGVLALGPRQSTHKNLPRPPPPPPPPRFFFFCLFVLRFKPIKKKNFAGGAGRNPKLFSVFSPGFFPSRAFSHEENFPSFQKTYQEDPASVTSSTRLSRPTTRPRSRRRAVFSRRR